MSEQGEARIYQASDGHTLPYRLFRPANHDRNKRYPLVILFHGSGERGDDNVSQLLHGVGQFVSPEAQAKFPSFLIAPQCPAEQKWVDVAWDNEACAQPIQPSGPMTRALEILEAVKGEFRIEEVQIYVTGISMGGYATWDLVTRYPGRYAAAVPICGGGDEKAMTAEAAKIPLWAFHCADDEVVPVGRTRRMIEAMRQLGGKPRYTEYPEGGHDSWTPAYAEPELLPWLFAQKKS